MTYAYPFDPNGTSPANLVSNEIIVLTGKGTKKYNYIIPKFAPFFGAGLVMEYKNTNGEIVELKEGVDYHLTHLFMEASKACAKPVYGSFTFVNENLSGTLKLSYQTIGDKWTLSTADIIEILATTLNNPRSTSWGSITSLPAAFPVIDHEWELNDMVGVSDVVEALLRIYQAVASGGSGGGTVIVPELLKEEMELDNVPNFKMASDNEAKMGLVKDRFMSPFLVALLIAEKVGNAFTTHAASKSNPHEVTAAQVGTMTTAEIQAADNLLNDLLVSLNSELALLGSSFGSHSANEANPHKVTAGQVGTWTAEEISAANSLINQAIGDLSLAFDQLETQYTTHAADETNPHNVTAEQLDAVKSEALTAALTLLKETYFDVEGKAKDSAKLEGKSLTEVIELARTASSDLLGIQSTHSIGALVGAETENWTLFLRSPRHDSTFKTPELTVLISGAGGTHSTTGATYLFNVNVNASIYSDMRFSLTLLAGTHADFSIGYVSGTEYIDFYIRNKAPRNKFTVTLLNDSGAILPENSPVLLVQPPLITYVSSVVQVVTATQLSAAVATLTATDTAMATRVTELETQVESLIDLIKDKLSA